MCRHQAGEIAFVYQNNKRKSISNIGEQIIIIYIWKIDGKGYTYLENQAFSTLNLRQWRRLCTLLLNSIDVWIWKYSSMFGFPWKNPLVNSQSWYIKRWVLWYCLGSIITILACTVCLEYSRYASHFLFHASLVTCRSAKKWQGLK